MRARFPSQASPPGARRGAGDQDGKPARSGARACRTFAYARITNARRGALWISVALAWPLSGWAQEVGEPPPTEGPPPAAPRDAEPAPPGEAPGEALGDAAPRPEPIPAAKPPPLNVEYLQYGVAIAAEVKLDAGAVCPTAPGSKPCILGSGGGLAIRGGYRSPGPWYVGGAYEFIKMDSSNLYRLGIFQQVRAEIRYLPDTGYRAAPYFSWGIGGVAYGNEWGVETGGGLAFVGAGIELEVSRLAVLGLGLVYRPVLLAGWTDTAGQVRPTAVAQFLGLELLLELRSEIGRN